MSEDTLTAVVEYLKSKFPDEAVRNEELRILVGDEISLLISEEFLETVEPHEVKTVLDWLDVAGELRRAEGLPMVLTEHGVRLESGN